MVDTQLLSSGEQKQQVRMRVSVSREHLAGYTSRIIAREAVVADPLFWYERIGLKKVGGWFSTKIYIDWHGTPSYHIVHTVRNY